MTQDCIWSVDVACPLQEEIRFSVCPELLVSLLLMESMADNEAILIQGFESYTCYRGYGKTLQYAGDFSDPAQVSVYTIIAFIYIAINTLFWK